MNHMTKDTDGAMATERNEPEEYDREGRYSSYGKHDEECE